MMAKPKTLSHTPRRGDERVIFMPRAGLAMQAGMNQIINLVRPTLGPLPRMVLNDLGLGRLPELLDSGGVIARRVIQVADRDEDMGAMFARHMLWRQHQRCGDGTVTAGVIFQTIYNEGLRYLAEGGNPMLLRARLLAGAEIILAELQGMTTVLEGKQDLARLAETICYDAELAKILGEVFDIIGSYGRLEVRSGHARQVEREYIEGMYWDGGFFSREMADPLSVRANLENPAICMTNLNFDEPADLVPVLELALQNQIQTVLLTARSLTDRANAVLLAKANREKVRVVVVKLPGARIDEQLAALEDMARLTGGRPLLEEIGSQVSALRLEDFGRARKAWAEKDFFGISGGKGDKRQLRQHMQALRSAYEREEEADQRVRLRERIGRLMGGAATVHVGGPSPLEISARKELAERTAEAMRGAMIDGVLPGGGAALLACRPALLRRLEQAADDEERAACRILILALEEPARTIIHNAGFKPDKVMAQVDAAGPGAAFDVRSRRVQQMADAGIYDSAAVVRNAVLSAVNSAALGLTTEVLVHLKNPPQVMET